VVKPLRKLCNRISADGKCLEQYHVLNIAEKCYDMQLVTIELDQSHVRLHGPNN
jgi:hypothetical protein